MKNYSTFCQALFGTGVALAALCLTPCTATASAVITIVNGNAPGVGFNDPTPVAPVGGNTGLTLGQQRLIAFQYAASIWGASLDSSVVIRILATFEALGCNSTSAVLGSAGATEIFSDFTGAKFPNTWYPKALANRLSGADLDPTTADIQARFNVNLGNSGCLTGIGWYYGLDDNHGPNIDLVTVLLHEFAHGLGFQQFANTSTGIEIGGRTDVYARNILDLTTGKTWDQMSNAERVASAINTERVVWKGPEVTSATGCALSPGTPSLVIHSPGSVAGLYPVGSASFGPQLSSPGVTSTLALAAPDDGCAALANLSGKIAVIDRGTCTFVVKVKNAQNAGAIAAIIVDNVAGSPPADLGGADPTIVIPSVRITLSDGNALKAAMAAGSVVATLGVDLSVRAGADPLGRALLYTPNPVQSGSTISHWDTSAFPNQLMEPAINADRTHNVGDPVDLTLALMRDIGWFPGWGFTKYDLNQDGRVNLTDYTLLMAAIRSHSTNPAYDLNCDGKVDISDARWLVLRFTNPGGTP